MKVFVLTYFSKSALDVSLGMLSSVCGVEYKDIIILSLNAGSEVEEYLMLQTNYKYILADENDSYGKVVNTAIEEFLSEGENVVLMHEGMTFFPDSFKIAEKYIYSEKVGAIIFSKISSKDGEYDNLEKTFTKRNLLFSEVGCGEEGVMLSWEMVSESDKFDDEFLDPQNSLVDYFFNCGQKGFKFYKSSDCVAYEFYKIPIEKYAKFDEISKIREKWGMNYFTYQPNNILMDVISQDFKGDINVLEVGCDCGGNGSGVREIYPKCHLYGLELNPNSAKIAATIYDEVAVGNAEEMELPFGNTMFDIVIFGDVLEHLRDPLGILKKCYSRMNKGGIVVTSIPNIMHYTVMRQLVSGRFPYGDEGLLDKTHIHFFTYYEIVKIFMEANFEIEENSSAFLLEKPSEEDDILIETLLSFSKDTNRIMYETFQYNVRARKK